MPEQPIEPGRQEPRPPRERPSRPFGVWLIAIYFAITSIGTLFYVIGMQLGNIEVTPEQAEYLATRTTLDFAFAALIAVLHLVGAITLFLMRKVSFHLFLASLVFYLGGAVYQGATRGWDSLIEGGIVGLFVATGLLVAVCIYTWRMTQAGLLR